jgi:S-adenosylmethionine decarboxylase
MNESAVLVRGNMAAAEQEYAPGFHVLLDMYGAQHLTDEAAIDRALREAAHVCGATVLEMRLHSFGHGQGITGVAILAESHISIHTWPETGFIALDVFMCGQCDARQSVEVLKAHFKPERMDIQEISRGRR